MRQEVRPATQAAAAVHGDPAPPKPSWGVQGHSGDASWGFSDTAPPSSFTRPFIHWISSPWGGPLSRVFGTQGEKKVRAWPAGHLKATCLPQGPGTRKLYPGRLPLLTEKEDVLNVSWNQQGINKTNN